MQPEAPACGVLIVQQHLGHAPFRLLLCPSLPPCMHTTHTPAVLGRCNHMPYTQSLLTFPSPSPFAGPGQLAGQCSQIHGAGRGRLGRLSGGGASQRCRGSSSGAGDHAHHAAAPARPLLRTQCARMQHNALQYAHAHAAPFGRQKPCPAPGGGHTAASMCMALICPCWQRGGTQQPARNWRPSALLPPACRTCSASM